MKKNRVYGVVLVFLLVGLSAALFSVNSAANEYPKTSAVGDVDYDFERNILYDGPVNITNDFNIANYSYYNGHYPANCSFENDIVGSLPFGWHDYSNTGVGAIIENHLDHNKVFNVSSNLGVNTRFSTSIITYINGTFEFWFGAGNTTKTYYFLGTRGSAVSSNGIIINIRIEGGNIYSIVGDGAAEDDLIDMGVLVDDELCHIKVFWDSVDDNMSVWRNGTLYVDGENFYKDNVISPGEIDDITLYGSEIVGTYMLFDAFDTSNDSCYIEGRNRFSDVYVDQVDKVVDRWEFAFEAENDFYDLGADNPSSWDDVEDGGDDINIIYDGGVSTYDRAVQIGSGGDQEVGLEKVVGHIGRKRITAKFGFNITEWSSDGGHISFELYSSTDNEVMHVYLSRIGGVIKLYCEGVYPSTSYIYPGLVVGKYYELDIYIDYIFNMSIVLLKEDGSYVDQYAYEVPLKIGGQVGCNIIKIMLETDVDEAIAFELDYVGLYRDKAPGSNDWGYIEQDFYAEHWDLNEFNLMYLDASGSYSASKYWTEAEINFVPEDILQEFLSYGYHNLDEGLKNLYGMTEHLGYPSLVFFIKNNFNPVDLLIEGVVMNDGEENVVLQFMHGGVDIDESYFYVSGDRLMWTMTVDDSGAEYITANFDLDDFACENRTFSFASDTDGSSYADLQLFYTDLTSIYLEIKHYYLTTTLLLPQEKYIERFTLYIYDNDEFEAGVYTGYIENVQTINYVDIIVSIGVINLLGIITPMIIMIVPPLAVSRKFGNKAILPMFVLMAVICFITSLIPAWLFFVIAFGLVAFIFMRKKVAKKGV